MKVVVSILLAVAAYSLPAVIARAGDQPQPLTAPTPTPADVRKAVERGLSFTEKAGLQWMKDKKCVACHHSAFMLRSHEDAKTRGLVVKQETLDHWSAQSMALFLNDEKDLHTKKGGHVESMNLILGHGDPPAADAKTQESLKKCASLMINAQLPDGSWKHAGQKQKRPPAEAGETTTMWAVLALTKMEGIDHSVMPSRDKALAWVKGHHIGDGNEAIVLRILIERRFGEAEKAELLANDLASRQNGDGGWKWGPDFPTDPFATGQALYALRQAGWKSDAPAIQRGVAFLLKAQKENGSFPSPTKKASGGNDIATYWGSTWATIGLIATLPDKSSRE